MILEARVGSSDASDEYFHAKRKLTVKLDISAVCPA